MTDRQNQLLLLIEKATGKVAYSGGDKEEGEEAEYHGDALEASEDREAA